MQIKISSILVNDQAKALKFYTDVLGFIKVTDIDLGQFRWLTVGDDGEMGIELVLEPNCGEKLPTDYLRRRNSGYGIPQLRYPYGE